MTNPKLLTLAEIEETEELPYGYMCEGHSTSICSELLARLFATARAALRVVEAAKTIDDLLCLSDKIYDVREREGEGWEGPKVKAYSDALVSFEKNIKPFRESPKGENDVNGGTIA